MDTRATRGCFIGYTDTDTIHKIWDFERRCFVNSHDVHFDETQFPEPTDFDESPADAYGAYHGLTNVPAPPVAAPPLAPESPTLTPVSSREPSPEPQPAPHLYDEIVVQLPPALQVFKSYTEFQHNNPPSFVDAMQRPDANLWWNAFCDEIKAIIKRNTWTLAHLPPGKKALPLRWVCRVKHDATNTFECYKARIIVKGFA